MTFRRALGAIVLVGLVLRLLYAYALVKSRPLLGDALEFQQQANLLASGHGLIEPQVWFAHHISRPSADKPPLYPFLEAAISVLGGRSWAWHDIVDWAGGYPFEFAKPTDVISFYQKRGFALKALRPFGRIIRMNEYAFERARSTSDSVSVFTT